MEAATARFQAAHTQVLGVSIDSVPSHAAWAASLGGISFPLLSDFEPKGAVASSLGVYLEGIGITDRATIIVDSEGIVRYAEAVGPGGQRDIAALAAECEKVDAASSGATAGFGSAPGLPSGVTLYVRNNCGASNSVLYTRDNVGLGSSLATKNVSDDSAAATELESASGGKQAPCLVIDGEAQLESAQINGYLVEKAAPPLA